MPVMARSMSGIQHLAHATEEAEMIDKRNETDKLVAANRILAREDVVDAFGHVSLRHPDNPHRYVMSRSRSPELVEFDDLMEFELDGEAVDLQGRTPYGERMIHGALFEARQEITAVIHNHSYDVLPFGITDTPMRPVIHVASVIGKKLPVWDIADKFGDTDLLVRTMEQGRDLAGTMQANSCMLMRGHGAVVAGRTLEEAVITAIYLQVNAKILAAALHHGTPKALSDGEIEHSQETQFSPLALDRAWEYFCVRAGMEPV
jgi:HCOMODA/2-hydroxy-3-carboxy-muconic semialdehyde decarboxylase